MSANSLQTIAPVPTQESLLEVLRRSLPPGFYEQLEQHTSFAVFRAIAAMWAALAESSSKNIAARYYLPHSLQRDVPSSSHVKASGNVTLIRDDVDNQPAIVANPGEMKIVGPGNRLYKNTEKVVWNPNDTGERIVQFECEVPGFVGNLDFVRNEDGSVDLDLVSLVDQDRGRTATGGTIIAGANPVLLDSGVPDVFAPDDVGLLVEIVTSSDATNVGKIRRINGFSQPGAEVPPGSGRFPNRVLLDPFPRYNISEVLLEDESAATFTDYTAEALNETVDDLPLLPPVPAVDDAIYFGSYSNFTSVVMETTTAGVGEWEYVWEYWTGASWDPIPSVVDTSRQWTLTGESVVSWPRPAGWATQVSPGGTGAVLYYARARLSSLTSATTVPQASRAVIQIPDLLADDSGSVTWKLRDFDDLGVQITACTAFTGGRDNDLWVLGDDRGVYQQIGEDDSTFRQRAARLLDVVSPAAIRRAIDRILSPYGYRGDAIDVSNGLTGYFLDVDFLDYYEAGDLFPTDIWKLPLSEEEARGFFLVLVPYLGLGEFGIGLDEGPITLLSSGEFVNGAVDAGFLDGSVYIADSLYSAIWSTISRIKAGGTFFDLVRSEELSALAC